MNQYFFVLICSWSSLILICFLNLICWLQFKCFPSLFTSILLWYIVMILVSFYLSMFKELFRWIINLYDLFVIKTFWQFGIVISSPKISLLEKCIEPRFVIFADSKLEPFICNVLCLWQTNIIFPNFLLVYSKIFLNIFLAPWK